MNPQTAVLLVNAVEKAQSRIPQELKGPTYYGSTDEWYYEESQHPNMCEDCHSYNMQTINGSQLRAEFPYHEVIDENFIYPKVHPHCFCGLVRLFPVDVDNEVNIVKETNLKVPEPKEVSATPEKQVEVTRESVPPKIYTLPPQTTTLSETATTKLMSLPDADFNDALDSMYAAGYIAFALLDLLRKKKKQQKNVNL